MTVSAEQFAQEPLEGAGIQQALSPGATGLSQKNSSATLKVRKD